MHSLVGCRVNEGCSLGSFRGFNWSGTFIGLKRSWRRLHTPLFQSPTSLHEPAKKDPSDLQPQPSVFDLKIIRVNSAYSVYSCSHLHVTFTAPKPPHFAPQVSESPHCGRPLPNEAGNSFPSRCLVNTHT